MTGANGNAGKIVIHAHHSGGSYVGAPTPAPAPQMTFACTGAVQQYHVPQGYTKIRVQAMGAAGGGSNAEGFQWPGGNGGKAEVIISAR